MPVVRQGQVPTVQAVQANVELPQVQFLDRLVKVPVVMCWSKSLRQRETDEGTSCCQLVRRGYSTLEVSHVFFVNMDSVLNVNYRPFHWSRGAFSWPWPWGTLKSLHSQFCLDPEQDFMALVRAQAKALKDPSHRPQAGTFALHSFSEDVHQSCIPFEVELHAPCLRHACTCNTLVFDLSGTGARGLS